MNRYGKPRNDNCMVNVCDDVVLFKRSRACTHTHTHKDSVKETNKMCKKNGTNDRTKENLRTPITHPTRTWNSLSQWWLWMMKKHGSYVFQVTFLAFSQRNHRTR
jgi:hypothetical protein